MTASRPIRHANPDFDFRYDMESQIRFILYAKKQDPEDTPDIFQVWDEAFRAGFAARSHLRPAARLQVLLADLQAP